MCESSRPSGYRMHTSHFAFGMIASFHSRRFLIPRFLNSRRNGELEIWIVVCRILGIVVWIKPGASCMIVLSSLGLEGSRCAAWAGNRAGEVRIGRFLRNEKVTVEKIVEQALLDTASRVDGLHILAIQDTTSFRDDGSGNSLVGHSTIAVEAEHGALLGLIDAQIIERSGSGERLPRKRALRDKQSQRWIERHADECTPDDVGGTGDGGCRPGR